MPKERQPGLQQALAVALQHHQAGRLKEAEKLYRQILQATPRHADALHLLGVLALQAGRDKDAVDLIGKAIAQNGQEPAFHNNLGNALQVQGNFEEAVASYQRALALEPDNAQTHYNLGVALKEQRKLDEAAASFRQALALRPDYAEAHNKLGNALQEQGKLDEAVASFKLALAHRPDYADARYGLGAAFQAQDKLDEAAECYRRVLTITPDCAEAHNNLGTILFSQGKADEAAASYGRALALKPDYAAARLGLAIASIPIFADSIGQSAETTDRFSRSLDDLAAWSNAHPGALGRVVGTSQPYDLAYRPQNITAPLLRYGELICAAATDYWRLPDERPVPPARERIRMVVVCGYVQQHHPVWNIVLRGIIAHLDRRRFEIVLYHTGLVIDDETAWARSHVDRFVQGPKSVEAWLDEIKQDQPDVIFYPEVGMDCATCALAALRLAPLQVVSGQGHPMTTGFPTMDVCLSGELMEGPGADQHYREKLVRLPGTGLCLEWTGGDAEPWDGPDRPADTVRFSLWVQPIKFDPANDVLFARIAKAVGPCEFWLVRPQRLSWTAERLRDRMAAAFRAEGLDPDAHLRLGSWLSRDQLSGLFDAMDVYLDSPAFSGCTTAWQAIHRGLPIVTLEGEFLRQRQTAGLLRQIGITDGIASTRDEYVEIAVRWAHECRQPEKRAVRREEIRRAAPKVDGSQAAVKAFEQTLIEALQGRA
jgi:predicted O-linked N-acetylglucosamine transferase (SPINDLY family)